MKILKIISRIHKKIISMFDGINTNFYVKKYNNWLKKNKMDINGNIKYVHHTVYFDGIDYSKIHIGDNVVISMNTIILIHDFSIQAGLRAINLENNNEKKEAHYLKDVYIGNNVFIGANVTLLGGTKLGDNCIVGAGAVLPGKQYPENSIIVGNPGKVIGNTLDWAKEKYNNKDYLEGFY